MKTNLKRKHKLKCEKCKKELWGYSNQRFCKICSKINNKKVQKITDKKYYEKNKEKLKKYSKDYQYKSYIPHPRKLLSKKEKLKKKREYYNKNRERLKEYKKIYRIKNKEKIREKNKEYYYNNLQKIKDLRKNYLPKRREKNKLYIKNKMLNNLQFNIKSKLRNRIYYAIKTYTKTGKIMTSKKYGIDYQAIIEHLKPFPEDISLYHVDHIKPLCSFNLEDPEEIKIAFAPENHQWLLAKDNLKKSSKDKNIS